MSTSIHQTKTHRGHLQITQFLGNCKEGTMLQLGQGISSHFGAADAPGFIQLSLTEVAELIPTLVGWVKTVCNDKANRLKEQIKEDQALEKTIFAEAVKCEQFIANFEVPKIAVEMLAKFGG